MNDLSIPTGPSALGDRAPQRPQALVEPPAAFEASQVSSGGFIALQDAYRTAGGTQRGDDLAQTLQDHRRGGYLSLAKLIVAGSVFGFEWRDTLWIPMFQFDPVDLSVRPGPRQILAKLRGQFDGWELATWFVAGNSWLEGRRPVDVLDLELPRVLDAARVDRFITAG